MSAVEIKSKNRIFNELIVNVSLIGLCLKSHINFVPQILEKFEEKKRRTLYFINIKQINVFFKVFQNFQTKIQNTEKIPEPRSIVSLSERMNCLSLKVPGNELDEYQYFEFFKGYDSPVALKEKSLTAILDIEWNWLYHSESSLMIQYSNGSSILENMDQFLL